MDIAFEHDPWLRAPRLSQAKAGRPSSLDWQGLAGRLAAAQAFHRQFAPAKPDTVSGGSFDPATARRLASYALATKDNTDTDGDAISAQDAYGKCSYGVNPILLADRKATSGIAVSEAGAPPPSGARGSK